MADASASQLETKREPGHSDKTKLTLLSRKDDNESRLAAEEATSRLPITVDVPVSDCTLSSERNMTLQDRKQHGLAHGRGRVTDMSKTTARRSQPAFTTAEPVVSVTSPMPPGYKFVSKGNPYITRHCRQETQQAHKTVYAVMDDKKKPVGIRVPKWVYEAVLQSERETHSERREAVAKRDDALERRFRVEILAKFPRIPAEEVPKIINRAMKKHAGRVGRTGKIELAEKAYLAVQAYIRHTKTDYDKLLNEGTAYQDARGQTFAKVREILVEWGVKDLKPIGLVKPKASTRRKTRKTTRKTTKVVASKTTTKPRGKYTMKTPGKTIKEKASEEFDSSPLNSDSDFEVSTKPERYVQTREPRPVRSGSERRPARTLSLRSVDTATTQHDDNEDDGDEVSYRPDEASSAASLDV